MTTIIYKDERPDPGQYMQLFSTTGWNDEYKVGVDELAGVLAGSLYVIAAFDGDDLVGMGRVVTDGVMHAMLYDVIVKPSHQNQGIGSTILKKLIERCKEAGVREIQLFSARGKAPFYRKRGFLDRPVDAPGMSLKRESSLRLV